MSLEVKKLIRAVLGEFLVTFIFLSVVFSMLMNNARSADPILNNSILPGIVVAFVSCAIIFSFADISGAHFNPAVTFGFLVSGKIAPGKGLAYILAQLIGAVAATVWMFGVFPEAGDLDVGVCAIVPASVPSTTPLLTAVLMEAFLTFLLVYVIFSTAADRPLPPTMIPVTYHEGGDAAVTGTSQTGATTPTTGSSSSGGATASKTDIEAASPRVSRALRTVHVATSTASKNNLAPIAIAVTLGFLCYLGGNSSGGAFNPARVFGPALMCPSGGNFTIQWVYWVGDLIGAGIAASLQVWIFSREKGILTDTPNVSL